MTREEKIRQIESWVIKYRAKHHCRPTPGAKTEQSCFLFGEGHNLVMRQLVYTTRRTGSWVSEIENGTDEVLDLALDFMRQEDPTLF